MSRDRRMLPGVRRRNTVRYMRLGVMSRVVIARDRVGGMSEVRPLVVQRRHRNGSSIISSHEAVACCKRVLRGVISFFDAQRTKVRCIPGCLNIELCGKTQLFGFLSGGLGNGRKKTLGACKQENI